MSRTLLVALLTLAIGLLAGFLLGRMTLEREWRQPQMLITPEQEKKSAAGDADPTPPAGAKVLRAMPLERTRLATKELTQHDPLLVKIGSFGNGDEGSELHLVMENRGRCLVSSLRGVAYAFDAFGVPAKANQGGEHYVAFAAEKIEIATKESYTLSAKLRYPETASLAVAHVDRVQCSDGTSWVRN